MRALRMTKRRVLIVEDSTPVAQLYTAILTDELGQEIYICEIAETLARAVKRLLDDRKPNIEVILLDLVLPNGAGTRIIRHLAIHWPEIPIIVITRTNTTVEEAINAGAQDLLYKGAFSQDDLLNTIMAAYARNQVARKFKPVEELTKEVKEDNLASQSRLRKMSQAITSGRQTNGLRTTH